MRTKRSMRIQKLIFYGFLIASFLVVIASFAYVSSDWTLFNSSKETTTSGFYNSCRSLIRSVDRSYRELLESLGYKYGSDNRVQVFTVLFDNEAAAVEYYRNLWFSVQTVNDLLFYTGLISCALVGVCAITGSFSRKKYYISNLVAGCVTGAFGIIMSLITMVKGLEVHDQLEFVRADIEAINTIRLETNSGLVQSYSTANCYITIIVPVIFIILSGLFIAYNVFRYVNTIKLKNADSLTKEVAI